MRGWGSGRCERMGERKGEQVVGGRRVRGWGSGKLRGWGETEMVGEGQRLRGWKKGKSEGLREGAGVRGCTAESMFVC